jgi:hypothetical protein
MTKLRTAEELFNEFCTMTDDKLVCYEHNVKALLQAHDSDIEQMNEESGCWVYALVYFVILVLAIILLLI